MRCTFYKWYSQALGATFGIIACIFGYLNGYMFVYTNIENNFDYLGFDGIISSYLLLPMCLLTLLFSIMRVYYDQETIFGIPFKNINNLLITMTIILGFLGTKMYFTIPCIIIIIGFISFSKITENINKNNSIKHYQYDNAQCINANKEAYLTHNQLSPKTSQSSSNNANNFKIDGTNVFYNKEAYTYNDHKYDANKESKLLITKQKIVIDLVKKNASIDFIKDITGFTVEEIEIIKNTSQDYID